MSALIYLTEDDENVRELIRCTLVSFSYEVRSFENAEDMLAECSKGQLPDLFLLDIMLPGIDGIRALKLLRQNPDAASLPVIMLTAKSSEADKVAGLDNGADDYIAKPFGVLELAARVRAVLRRKPLQEHPSVLTYKDIVIDCDRHCVTIKGEPADLTVKEYDLLLFLVRNSRRVVTREELFGKVWGYDFEGESRTLDMHILSLRNKLGDNAERPCYIKTVRGVGYSMV